jgi:hypothetical protein
MEDGAPGERGIDYLVRSNATHASTTDPDARLYRRALAWKQGSAFSDTS